MDSSSTVSWEMVVPKMVRPAPKAPPPEIAPPAAAGEEKNDKRLQLVRLAWAVGITLVGILVLLMVHRWVAVPKQAAPVQTASAALKLETEPQGNGRIDIRWNPKSAPIAQAREARLVVMERDQQPRVVPLDAEQLKAGHLTYPSATDRIVLRLEVTEQSGAVTKESTLALLPEMTPPPSPQTPEEAANRPTPAKPVPAAPNVKAKASAESDAEISGPQAGRPLIRTFTPPRRIVGDPGERPALLPDPPAAVASGSNVSPLRLPESVNRLAPPPAKQKPAEQPPAEPLKVGGNLQAGKLIRKVTPVYPSMAGIAHVQGTVRLTAVIGKDGTIQNLKPISGPSLLVPAATDAVKQWVYKPTILNGEPVEVQTQIDVNFNLNQ